MLLSLSSLNSACSLDHPYVLQLVIQETEASYNEFNLRYDTIRLQTIVTTSFSLNQGCRSPSSHSLPDPFGFSNTCFSAMESTVRQKIWQCAWKFTPGSTGAPKAKNKLWALQGCKLTIDDCIQVCQNSDWSTLISKVLSVRYKWIHYPRSWRSSQVAARKFSCQRFRFFCIT